MNIDQIVVMGVVIVIVMTIFVSMVELVIPTIKKLEFDATCRNYLLLAEAQNGLDNTSVDALKERLNELGFSDVIVNAHHQNVVMRGNLYSVDVEGIYHQPKLLGLFKRVEAQITLKFEQSYLARKIIM
ncbi:hypothetical protein QE109_13675 [Fusibacter bizertensis]|uniref:DUF4845 domain-containing protein n=1 Tax=Fusibacter bizertensis TaxID=1488331 RepID=A0ABT6NFK7_9FIRM|nr:hypothetical protein [Fusibacter bizertensis]MDH8679201.1 hypothetical protein [Fusibacter bizertensis]